MVTSQAATTTAKVRLVKESRPAYWRHNYGKLRGDSGPFNCVVKASIYISIFGVANEEFKFECTTAEDLTHA